MEANFDIEGNLRRTIHVASEQQEDRETIQKTLRKHRNLNPYGGEHSDEINLGSPYNEEEERKINKVLRKAGVSSRINGTCNNIFSQESSLANQEEDGWCQILPWIKQGNKGRKWQEIFEEKAFNLQVESTIQRLKTLKSQANYRRRKIKLLATRHAGMTMTTGDLKKLNNP